MKVEIWYTKRVEGYERNPFAFEEEPKPQTEEELRKFYAKVHVMNVPQEKTVLTLLEKIFMDFNLSSTNPLATSQGQNKVRELKVHTSMSVGDIIKVDDNYYHADNIGFTKINPISEDSEEKRKTRVRRISDLQIEQKKRFGDYWGPK